ncbi:MAG: hypothetical protein IKJ34_01035 [Mailhella sp.]|nr:hypothetical protein [Mailhella sp.]
MSWEKQLEELEFRRQESLKLGGEANVARQHEFGKKTIRERIDLLLDKTSFLEVGQLTGTGEYDENGNIVKVTPSPYVCGLGKIDGRFVCVGGEDFTIRGGTGGGLEKRKGGQGGFIEEMAADYLCPMINLIDGAGASVTEAAKGYKRLPGKDAMDRSVDLLGKVPVCSAVLGSVAGGPSGRAILSHFSVMVDPTSQIFAAGPPVVERALGHKLTKQELGGPAVAAMKGGTIDNVAKSEEEAMDMIRRFLSYLPSNVWEMAPRVQIDDPIDRKDDALLDIVPENRKRAYNMYKIIKILVDRDSFFEIQPGFGKSIIVGFARFNGYTAGIVANNPMVLAGAMDANSSRKVTHFASLCNMFHIPMIHLLDCPGFMLGLQSEEAGTLRFGMGATFEVFRSEVPRLTVAIRKAYGMGSGLSFTDHTLRYRMAWPSAEFGSLPIEGGVAAAYRREIAAAADPAKRTAELEAELLKFSSPFRSAEHFSVEDIIDPRETRYRLCMLVEAAQGRIKTLLGRTPTYGVRP